jgi:tetratricopeptide (TPR) repeat protein
LAASGDAQRYFEHALELADEPRLQAELSEQAGDMARTEALNEEAAVHFERAIQLFHDAGLEHAVARVDARLAEVLWDQGRLDEAIDRMERAFSVLATDEPDEDLAMLAAQLARFHYFSGHTDAARERVEFALDIAESLELPLVLSHALNTKSIILTRLGSFEEGVALLSHSLKIALDNELHAAALRAYTNLGATLEEGRNRSEEALRYAMDGLALARKVGGRTWEWSLLSHAAGHTYSLGRWDEAISWAGEIPSPQEVPAAGFAMSWTLPLLIQIAVYRGEVERGRGLLEELEALPQSTADEQNRSSTAYTRALVLRAEGRLQEAFDAAMQTISIKEATGANQWAIQAGAPEAFEAALQMHDLAKAAALLAEVRSWPRREISPALRGGISRMSARLAAEKGELQAAEEGFLAAIDEHRKRGDPYILAQPLAELAELLIAQGRVDEAEPLLAEAQEIFERLGARPWLERIERIQRTVPRVASGV